jgi:hypothetical protein
VKAGQDFSINGSDGNLSSEAEHAGDAQLSLN